MNFVRKENDYIWSYEQIQKRKKLVALSAFIKFFSTLDFGYNMYEFDDIDVVVCASTKSFTLKIICLSLMISTIYMAYFRD